MARIVIATTGSGGDLFPFVPVADELRNRGHEVVVAAPPSLLHVVGHALGESTPVGPFVARNAVREHHAFDDRWWGYRGFEGYWRLQLQGMARTAADLRRVVAGADLVLAHVFHPAAVIAADAERVPLATLNLHPAFQPAPDRPPPGVPSLGRLGDRLAWRALRSRWRREVDPGINAVRSEHGLPALPDAALLGSLSGRRAFDLVDPWYADGELHPGHGAPTTGYPRWEPPAELDAGVIPLGDDPLVVITLGTALPLDPGHFYGVVTEAVSSLPVRALVLGANPRALPPAPSDRVVFAPFVPLSQVLPSAALLVHHGGTGTSHTAVALGCPSLVIPRTFDQRYQADRLVTVGVARSLPWRRLDVASVASAMRGALADRQLAATVRKLADGIRDRTPPAVVVAEAIRTSELVP